MPKKKLLQDDEILHKALLIISEKGPDTFTLQDIANSVGLAPATLLQRFGSKQKLLHKACLNASSQLAKELEALKAKKLFWFEELLELLSQLPEGFGSRQDIANSLGLLKLDMVDPELHPIARKMFTLLRTRILELLEPLATSHDIETISWELDALKHGLIIQWTLSGKGTLQAWLQRGIRKYLEKKINEAKGV